MSEKAVLRKDEKIGCFDCDAAFGVPENVVAGEIVTCPSCGLEFEVKKIENNIITLEELTIEGEDWGE